MRDHVYFVTFSIIVLFSEIHWRAGSNDPAGWIKRPRGPDQTTPRAGSNHPRAGSNHPAGRSAGHRLDHTDMLSLIDY